MSHIPEESNTFADCLLGWYDENGRSFVFRGTKDPYRVWLSEIMLQQTRTESAGPYYERFLSRFPDVAALAAADEESVLCCWQGLGYYTRARNLHKAAKMVVSDFGGAFPRTAEALRTLPGVGAYTAAAVASIAFGECVPSMDGNLIRVFSRLTDEAEDASQPATVQRLAEEAKRLMPQDRPGDYNQALMDLGATVCTPGTPDCSACPIQAYCLAAQAGHPETRPVLPRKAPPICVPLNLLMIFGHGRVYLRQRREALLKGMYVFALSEDPPEQALNALGLTGAEIVPAGEARHVFTHRVWEMTLWAVHIDHIPPALEPTFYTPEQMDALPVPTAMRAACAYVRKELHQS